MQTNPNGAQPDGSTSTDDRPADGQPRVVNVYDPVIALTTMITRLHELTHELRQPADALPAELRIADLLDDIIGRAGEVWPAAARFARVRSKRDADTFELTLNGIPFPFALDAGEPITVTQRFGQLSVVTLPVLAELVDLTDVTVGVRTVVGVPDVLVDHPCAEARSVVGCPVHGPHPHGTDDGQAIGCLDCPICFPPAERAADPEFDHAGEAGTVPEQDDAGRPIDTPYVRTDPDEQYPPG